MTILGTVIVVSGRNMIISAQRAKCSQNLKQIYYYLSVYLEQNHGRWPVVKGLDQMTTDGTDSHATGESLPSLQDFLSGYFDQDLSSLFHCPADPRSPQQQEEGSYDLRTEWVVQHNGLMLSQVKDASQTIVMGDYRAGWHNHWNLVRNQEPLIQVLFADGHIELITEREWQENLKRH